MEGIEIFLLLLVFAVWNIFGEKMLKVFLDLEELNFVLVSPNYLYKKTDMNYFGSVCMCIFYALLCPIYFIITFIIWLFHIGRKES